MIENSFVKSKFLLGLALIILGAVLFFPGKSELDDRSGSFKNEPVDIEGLSSYDVDENDLPVRVIIPKINIDLNVKLAKVVNGYWEVFNDYAAWGEGSGIPGRSGNQVIFAHARDGLFLPLKFISIGDTVFVLTKEKWYLYKVDDITEVYPNEIEVIKQTEDEELTLYTCSGYHDQKRLIVKAIRI